MAASGDMASDAQRRLLKMEGANPRLVDSPSLTKREASTWIDELKACGGDQARKTSVAERIPATGASARPASASTARVLRVARTRSTLPATVETPMRRACGAAQA